MIKNLEVILKTVERCNINCSYCYFFNGPDQSFLQHPPYISESTILNTAKFLDKGSKDLNIKSITIDLHGGEPLMQDKDQFDNMCKTFTKVLGKNVTLKFKVQTNGMLINDQWINLFERHQVGVGVSLDGPKEYNDKFRINKKGVGTYEKTVKGIRFLQKAFGEKRIPRFGLLCVINPNNSAKKIFHHFVNELNVYNMDFLIPDLTHDTMNGQSADDYGNFLCELFSAWTDSDNPDIFVRILNSTTALLMGKKSKFLNFGPPSLDTFALTIASDGSLAPDDTLRSSDPSLMQTGFDVVTHDLLNFMKLPQFNMLQDATNILPIQCQSCCWEKVCWGGMLINRYKRETKFDNPSVMCSGLKKFYSHVTEYLIERKVSVQTIKRNLSLQTAIL